MRSRWLSKPTCEGRRPDSGGSLPGYERTLDIRGKITDNFAISDLVGVLNAAVGNSAARDRASLNFT